MCSSDLGEAQIRAEGSWVSYDGSADPTPEEIEFLKSQPKTTWIEFSLPEELEEECWAMIEKWLESKLREKNT